MSARKPVPATASTLQASAAAPAITTAPSTPAPAAAAPDAGNADQSAASSSGDAANERTVEVRVLTSFGEHEPNDVIELTEAEARALGAAVDADPAAVAYAKSLKA